MIFVSDVHDSPEPLRRVASLDETLVVLGDLVNLTDYRTGAGAVEDVMGAEFAGANAEARKRGDYEGMRGLWREQAVSDDAKGIRESIGRRIADQYSNAGSALAGGRGYVIHGNVDRPEVLEDCLPDGFRYMHGDVIDIEGLTCGFVGGGVSTPIGAAGEVSDDEMAAFLANMDGVDVLCTHVPPAVSELRTDVITGREERGSEPILDFLLRAKPRFHFFGDVHQPRAAMWRVGATACFNAGYFRATGRYLRLEAGIVQSCKTG